ncbi:MAG: hypothetical protein K0Q95_3253 [Bacteroidota bacterium]|jgi:hypothetical protein|nr:hypothetical protein [Bacteroidota bacterium]
MGKFNGEGNLPRRRQGAKKGIEIEAPVKCEQFHAIEIST